MKMAAPLILVSLLLAGCEKSSGRTSSASGQYLTQKEAAELIAKLPEVEAWRAAVAGRGRGRATPIWHAEGGPDDCRRNGDRRLTWTICFSENRPDGRVNWRRFRVDAATGDIFVQDLRDGAYISLMEWRRGYRNF